MKTAYAVQHCTMGAHRGTPEGMMHVPLCLGALSGIR
jgi:hypothetical protein